MSLAAPSQQQPTLLLVYHTTGHLPLPPPSRDKGACPREPTPTLPFPALQARAAVPDASSASAQPWWWGWMGRERLSGSPA